MKRALQAILIAGEKMRDDVFSGRKEITVREGHRDYTLGPVLIGCYELNWATMRQIVAVQHTYLGTVSKEDLQADGFEDWTDAVRGLMEYYPDISLTSPVTVIKWSN